MGGGGALNCNIFFSKYGTAASPDRCISASLEEEHLEVNSRSCLSQDLQPVLTKKLVGIISSLIQLEKFGLTSSGYSTPT